MPFFIAFVWLDRNRVLLTSDLLPNMSLVVGQSSVDIPLALQIQEVFTSPPTGDILGNKSL